jgi:hypothetical protein
MESPMLKFLSIAASLTLAASPAVAAPQENDKAVSDANKVVCKRVAGTGWRLSSTKVCRTKAEWAAQAQAERESLKNDRDTMSNSPGGGN